MIYHNIKHEWATIIEEILSKCRNRFYTYRYIQGGPRKYGPYTYINDYFYTEGSELIDICMYRLITQKDRR